METTGRLEHWADFTVLAGYFGLVFLVGIWSLCRSNRGTVRGYFLAGGSMTWLPVGASVFVSNIGSEHFVGLAGTGAASGTAIVLYEWLALILLVVLGWLFLPVYMSARVYTMPEYMEKRFGGKRIRLYLSCLSVVLYIVAKLAVSIFSGALFIQLSTGWNMYISIAVLLVITAIFTMLGGLVVVMYTDTIQTFIMLAGALVLTALGMHEVGGYENLKTLYMNATPSVRDINSTCGLPREDAFSVIRDPITSDNPFPGLMLHMLFGCMWYWCCDQVIVQRALAAKNLQHAKAGCIFAGYLKILPMYIMVLPGMISRALYPDEVACVDPDECIKYCGNPVGCSNIAYPKLVLELLPTGLRGLLMAVMMSAIMSSLTSVLNSSSTLFTMDIWPRIRKSATQRELLIAGRIFVVILAALSILWIPLVKTRQSGQLFVYIIVVQGYLATPIGPIFLIATLWKRMTEPAAFWSLVIGQVVGIIRMVLDFYYAAPSCGEPETRPEVLYKVHYTYFGVICVVITCITVTVISLFTKPRGNVDGLIWQTRYKESPGPETQEARGKDLEASEQETQADPGKDMDASKHEMTKTQDKDMGSPERLGNLDVVTQDNCPEKTSRGFVFWLSRLCGIPEKSRSPVVYTERHVSDKTVFLKETPKIKAFLDLIAIFGISVVAFLIGYYR